MVEASPRRSESFWFLVFARDGGSVSRPKGETKLYYHDPAAVVDDGGVTIVRPPPPPLGNDASSIDGIRYHRFDARERRRIVDALRWTDDDYVFVVASSSSSCRVPASRRCRRHPRRDDVGPPSTYIPVEGSDHHGAVVVLVISIERLRYERRRR